jgi:hypothetical protein
MPCRRHRSYPPSLGSRDRTQQFSSAPRLRTRRQDRGQHISDGRSGREGQICRTNLFRRNGRKHQIKPGVFSGQRSAIGIHEPCELENSRSRAGWGWRDPDTSIVGQFGQRGNQFTLGQFVILRRSKQVPQPLRSAFSSARMPFRPIATSVEAIALLRPIWRGRNWIF